MDQTAQKRNIGIVWTQWHIPWLVSWAWKKSLVVSVNTVTQSAPHTCNNDAASRHSLGWKHEFGVLSHRSCVSGKRSLQLLGSDEIASSSLQSLSSFFIFRRRFLQGRRLHCCWHRRAGRLLTGRWPPSMLFFWSHVCSAKTEILKNLL